MIKLSLIIFAKFHYLKNVFILETLEEDKIKRTIDCLQAELNVLLQEDQRGASCVNKLWNAEHSKKTDKLPYPPQSVKEQQHNCYDFRREIKEEISKKFNLLRMFLKRQ